MRRELTRFRRVKNLVGEYGQFIVDAVIDRQPMKFGETINRRSTWTWTQHNRANILDTLKSLDVFA